MPTQVARAIHASPPVQADHPDRRMVGVVRGESDRNQPDGGQGSDWQLRGQTEVGTRLVLDLSPRSRVQCR